MPLSARAYSMLLVEDEGSGTLPFNAAAPGATRRTPSPSKQRLRSAKRPPVVSVGIRPQLSQANESIASGVEASLALTGGFLDAVVQNAGVAAGGAFEDMPDAELRRVMDTNFFGVMAVTRALLPTFRKQRSGRIVVVSSESGFHGQPGNSIYCASKWAVEGWAESLAYEVEQFGIKVLLIEPGPYVTDIWHSSPRIAPSGSAYRRWSEHVFRAGDGHVAANGGNPQDVALKIANVLEAKKPSFRNPVHRLAHFARFARGKIPTSLMRKVVERYLGLNRVQL